MKVHEKVEEIADVLSHHHRVSEFRADCECGAFFTTSPSRSQARRDYNFHLAEVLVTGEVLK